MFITMACPKSSWNFDLMFLRYKRSKCWFFGQKMSSFPAFFFFFVTLANVIKIEGRVVLD